LAVKTADRVEPYVNLSTAAAFLGKPESWLYNRADELGVPRYKIGNVWRFRLSELDAWVKGQ
jgi:predicted DNA-binding transcriptional regulator AlpA